MNKLVFCLLALSIAGVYVDCASLKSNTVPYDVSMQRFIDIVEVYKQRFPASEFVQGLYEDLNDEFYKFGSFFPNVLTFAMFPGLRYTVVIMDKFSELFKFLNIDAQEFDWEKIQSLMSIFDEDTDSEEFIESTWPVGTPMLDFIEAIDWSLLFTFSSSALPDHFLNFLGLTLKDAINEALDDLSKVKTVEELANFDYFKYIKVLNAMLAIQGIDIGK